MASRLSVVHLILLLLSSCLHFLHASDSNRHFPPIRAMSPPNTKPSDLPFPYVGSTVTAAKIMMDASQVTSYDGADKDHIAVDILGQGPVPFSISRFNRGDLSPRISPRSVPYFAPVISTGLWIFLSFHFFVFEEPPHAVFSSTHAFFNNGLGLSPTLCYPVQPRRHPYSQTNLGVVAGDEGYTCDDPRQFPVQVGIPILVIRKNWTDILHHADVFIEWMDAVQIARWCSFLPASDPGSGLPIKFLFGLSYRVFVCFPCCLLCSAGLAPQCEPRRALCHGGTEWAAVERWHALLLRHRGAWRE